MAIMISDLKVAMLKCVVEVAQTPPTSRGGMVSFDDFLGCTIAACGRIASMRF